MLTRVATYDANFAYAESDRVRSSIVTAYAFPESDAPTADLIAWLAERASGIARLRQRMVRPYGDIGDAYWSDSPDFNALDHIEEYPTPTWEGLRAHLAGLHSTGFDSSRPLWHTQVIRGVNGIEPANGPCTVVVLKFHHATMDGMGAADIARALFSTEKPTYTPSEPASRAKVTALEAIRLPLRPFLVGADLWRLVQISRRMTRDRKAGRWVMPDIKPRLTAINHPCGPDRNADIVFHSVSEIRRAVEASGGTASVNDALLAVIGGAMARHLGETEHGLVATVPVSVREHLPADARNALGFGMVELRPDLPFAEQIQAINRSVQRERARFQLPSFAEMFSGMPRFSGLTYRALDRFSQSRSARKAKPVLTQLRISTIPRGPSDGWEMAGLPVVATFGVTPLSDGLGVNHTIARIGDVLAIGVIADPAQLPDLDGYIETLRNELRDLSTDGQFRYA